MKNFVALTLTSSTADGGKGRNGVAPLEMVLVLPLLMMLMAIIIVFGYASSWKLRTETVARDVMWRNRINRFTNRDAVAPEWPTNAVWGNLNSADIQAFDAEQVLDDPIISGPIPNVNVNSRRLDFSRGVRAGVAEIDREPPIFSSLTRLNFRVVHELLDDRFMIRNMGSSNWRRRMPLIYEIGLDFIRSSGEILAAIAAIDNSPFRFQLEALEDDREFIEWRGRAPDFHPRVRGFCDNDPGSVQARVVAPLLRRIEQLPLRMARASINLYRQQLNADPPPSATNEAELLRKITALEEWLSRIDDRN